MKSLLIAGVLLVSLVTGKADILVNGDFSDGTTHWHGDLKPAGADTSTDFVSNPSSAKGILIELRSSTWTKVTQDITDPQFSSGNVSVALTIEYTISSDFKASSKPSIDPLSLETGGFAIETEVGKIKAFIDVPPLQRQSAADKGNVTEVTIYPDAISGASFSPETGTQTFSAKFLFRNPYPGSKPIFCIAVPPGEGSVTITRISLMPAGDPQPFIPGQGGPFRPPFPPHP